MSPLRVLRGFIFGGIGGLIGWFLIEFLPFGWPFQPGRFETPGTLPPQTSSEQQALLGLVLGLTIGGLLGISEGIAEGTTSRFWRSTLSFLGVGAIGGFIGLYFGQALYTSLGGQTGIPQSGGDFLYQILARSLGWMMLGLFLGVVFGVPSLSLRRGWNGAVGGAIGGFLGGFFFQTLAASSIFHGTQGRLVGFTVLGACIGFFISLIAEALKRVWVKVLIGRNEGREHVVDQAIAYVGRDELVEIPVFLDPAVPKRMASFRATSGRYALYPESPALPILVNGQPLTPGQVLRDGDAIQFGRVTLGYYEKATATGGSRRPIDTVALADFSPRMQSAAPVAIPVAAGVCQFCGVPFDAGGACACSVPADPGGGGYAPPPPAYGAPDPGYAAAAPAMPSAGGPQLIGLSGPYGGRAFSLASENAIGREPSHDVPLPDDSSVSRRHAQISYTPNGWVIRDEGSSNGTWVNGVRVNEQPLFAGDSIKIGHTEFRIDA